MSQAGELTQESGNWIKLRAGDVEFIVPQNDVVKTGYLQTALTSHAEQAGLLVADNDGATPIAEQGAVHYLALSSQLTLLNACPKERFLLATFIGSDWQWCWDDVTVLLDTTLNVEPLPTRLATPYTPILGVIMMNGKPVFRTSAERVFKYVSWQMQNESA